MNSTEQAGKDMIRILDLIKIEENSHELNQPALHILEFIAEILSNPERAYCLITFMALGLEKFVFYGKEERMMEFLDVVNEWAGMQND